MLTAFFANTDVPKVTGETEYQAECQLFVGFV